MSKSIRPEGRLTLDTVAAQLDTLAQSLDGNSVTVDFSAVTEADSSAVALLLAWARQARERNVTLTLVAVPEGLRSLIAVYGVSDLLQVS